MKTFITFIIIFMCLSAHSQTEDFDTELIKLATIYKKYHVSSPTDEIFEHLDSINHIDLQKSKSFIEVLITPYNPITVISSNQFLTKPDSTTLQNLYLIRGLTWNMFNPTIERENFGLDTIKQIKAGYNEMLSSYYSMLFTSIINKHRPFDMSSINFDMEHYNLTNRTEKAIFFLESMETCGTLISGYFYIDPPNLTKAMDYFNKYPSFNGEAYYNYNDLDFEDFNLLITTKRPKESFKHYELNKYLNTLLRHSMCLSQDPEKIEKMKEVLSNSILINKSYWQYSKTPEVLEKIFGK